MAERSRTTWIDRSVRRIKDQPARMTVLAMLVTVLALLWVRHFARGGAASPAAAAPAAREVKPQAAPVAENLPRAALALGTFLSRPPSAVGRNLFAVQMDRFPVDPSKASPAGKTVVGGFWDELTKSLAAKADQEKARRILLANLQADAAKLNLRGTLKSDGSPRALVDGKLVAEGDVVAGFRIVQIETNRIVVERAGVKFEVRSSFNQ